MYKQLELNKLDDYFLRLCDREESGFFFYRINGYNSEIENFLVKYYESARLKGVVIEEKLSNPDNSNIKYFSEIIGDKFQIHPNIIAKDISKWLPRISGSSQENLANAIYNTLIKLRNSGKNDNMLRNVYVKIMCWLYYKFDRILSNLGDDNAPKILYEGEIGYYELLLLRIIAMSGCDVVILQYNGDKEYLMEDPSSENSIKYCKEGQTDFPSTFSLNSIRKIIKDRIDIQQYYGEESQFRSCTNAWVTGDFFSDVRKSCNTRGTDGTFFYNCFFRINGVKEKTTYEMELFQLYSDIVRQNRNVLVLNTLERPTNEEISQISRHSYKNAGELILDLKKNIDYSSNNELKKLMVKAFVDVILEESKLPDMNTNKLTGKAVNLLCWLRRFQQSLFKNWKYPDIACTFYMGGCKNENEAIFVKFLSKLPVDVVIFNPNLGKKCCLVDNVLLEHSYNESMYLDSFPEGSSGLRAGTIAYHAERELDSVMYQDTGIYRNQQYSKANSVSLQTMYEEIRILWDEEVKYRPNFSVVENEVNIPVIFSKISGVKNSDVNEYWRDIKELITADTILIKKVPHIISTAANPVKPYVNEFYKHGRLLKDKIKEHKAYQYGYLRESVQDYILDKIKVLIEQKMIKGTFETGTEYAIIYTALNLDIEIVRLIQSFDFTKKNPKLIFIITSEESFSLEDTIAVAFLNLVGFDILMYVPTGYQCVEKYLNKINFEEHQIGEYCYDLEIPVFESLSSKTRSSWRERLFGKGK